MSSQAVLAVLPEWSPHWCVTPGCQHMPAMGHEFCCCCEERGAS